MPTRAHVVLPEDLIEEVDRVAGKRKRSRFVEEAIREKLARERQSAALRSSAGILDVSEHPHWSTPEKTSEWVRSLRKESMEHLERKLCGLQEE